MDVLNVTPEQWYEKENEWVEAVKKEEVWSKIPLLNVNELHNFKDKQLVKFTGMVQDLGGPEYYLEKCEVINENTRESSMKVGKYIDIVDCNPNETINVEGPNTVRSERQCIIVISVPGLNSWAKKVEEEKFKLLPEASSAGKTLQKRSLDDMETGQTEPQKDEQSGDTNKKQCTEPTNTETTKQAASQEYFSNVPIPNPSGKISHIRIYQHYDKLKLTSVCEFVGFLSLEPSLPYQDSFEEEKEIEFQVHNPPPSLVPRIHCTAFKHLKHSNPLVDDKGMTPERMQYVKKELLILLTQLLLGDQLAAEYLLYHLISEVYSRKEYLAIGKFSLNIYNVPTFENHDYVQELYKFIELIMVKSHYISMSLENLNSLTFVPKKDYSTERLHTSILQLSSNTHLVLDETKLSAGKLNEGGVDGVRSLTNTIKKQKILYDFTYYRVEFDCDLPFLIFSEGKSMLPSDFSVPLEPDEMHLKTFSEIIEAARHFLKPELLNEIRIYLTLARLTPYEITDDMQEMVQNDFVNMRQQKESISGDDLHDLLVLARLISISQGKNSMDKDCWEKACELEEARKKRLTKTPNAENSS